MSTAYFLLIAGALVMVGCERTQATPAEAGLPVAPRPHIRGVTLDARRVPGDSTLLRLRAMGVSHISLVPFGFQSAPDRAEIRMNPEGGWYSESDRGIRALAREADALGMTLFLKPHLWIGGWEGENSPARIGFGTESGWRAWEEQYRAFILHYARLSEEVGAPVFSVGTELARAARERPAFWRGLIRDVRTVYSGKLTYAANWHDEYEHIAFWPALDFVGVQAYFPISEAKDPSPDQLRAGWAPHRERLAAVSQRTGRPVLFTEIGYRSVPYAAEEPWRWPAEDEAASVRPDFELQAALYRAFFEALWEELWFAGAVVWKVYPHANDRGEQWALDFTPQGKPAAEAIGPWFRRGQPVERRQAPKP